MQHYKQYIFGTAGLFALAAASIEQRGVTISLGGTSLPSCPGAINIVDSSTGCCVGGSVSVASLNLSTCPGWPICTGPGTVSASSTPDDPPLTCATVIDMNDPNYSSILAAATSSIEASGTMAATTINPTGPAATPGESVDGSSSARATTSSSASRASSAVSAASSAAGSATTSAATNAAATAETSILAVSGVLAWMLAAIAAIL